MDVLSPAVRTTTGPRPHTCAAEDEVVQLRAEVARLQAERAALWWAVGHDELTGLVNRRRFATLAQSLLRTGRSAVLIVLDLNGFKPINDRLGHEAGDRVLQVVAQRLASCAGGDLVARLGGDEFTGVLTSARGTTSQWWRTAVAELSATIAEPMPVAGQLLNVTASIGVAPAHADVPIGELLRRADLAMYHAKASGNRYALWVDHAPSATAVSGTRPRATVPADLPTCDPHQREAGDVAPASSYRRDDPVWVYREGAWRPGVVESASSWAVMATYRYTGTGTVVDTMAAEYVMARTAADAQLDRSAA